jgi:hypothetical protein
VLPSGSRKLRIIAKLVAPDQGIIVSIDSVDIEVRPGAVQSAQAAIPSGASQVAFAPVPVTLDFSSNQTAGSILASTFQGPFGASASGVALPLKATKRTMGLNDFYWSLIPLNRYWSIVDTLVEGTYSAQATFTYDPASDLPSGAPGFSEDSLQVAGLNPLSSELEVLPSVLDKTQHTVTSAYTRFFDTYVVASIGTTIIAGNIREPLRPPRDYSLKQNYPDPFNPTTTIRYELPVESRVSLRIYNVLGQVVGSLEEGIRSAGYHSAGWNASNFPSGVYLYRLNASSVADPRTSFTSVRKMVLIR